MQRFSLISKTIRGGISTTSPQVYIKLYGRAAGPGLAVMLLLYLHAVRALSSALVLQFEEMLVLVSGE